MYRNCPEHPSIRRVLETGEFEEIFPEDKLIGGHTRPPIKKPENIENENLSENEKKNK